MAHYDQDTWELVLTTGTRLQANEGIIGINHKLNVYEGFDGPICAGYLNEIKLTKEERKELADYVIDKWRQFAERED